MIQEVIVTTHNQQGQVHIAPMGVHVHGEQFIILPFKPSTTLNNVLNSETAVINYCDDVRIFAGCLTGRRDWATELCPNSGAYRLSHCLAHTELQLQRIEDDTIRPKLFCDPVLTVNHHPFKGFNRAQYAVLEAAILVSRLHMLPKEKIDSELAYLEIGLNKTAGEHELEAWGWLMQTIKEYQQREGKNQ